MEPDRFRAMPILALSDRSKVFSPSDEELLPLSVGVLPSTSCMMCSEERFAAFPASMVRNGDVSVSEEERLVNLGGGGDPYVFFDRNPAWKRFAFGLISTDG